MSASGASRAAPPSEAPERAGLVLIALILVAGVTNLKERVRDRAQLRAAIAESLVLTKRAVEKHINSIFQKLGVAFADDVSKRVKAALLFLADRELSPG